MATSLEAAFEDDAAFIPYLAAGDTGGVNVSTPEEAVAVTEQYVEALVAGGADIVELGFPFSEPIADGPTIRAATVRALQRGMTPRLFLALVDRVAELVPVVAMTYYNPIYQFGEQPGVREFVNAAATAGLDGLIVPDLPVEESDPLRQACEKAGIALIFIAAPTTRDDRLERILTKGSGYLYVQARLGTTGARVDVSDHTRETLARIAQFENHTDKQRLPKAVGFGISTREHAADVVASGADGVIVGSALVDEVAAGNQPDAVTRTLTERARELKAGAHDGLTRRRSGPETT